MSRLPMVRYEEADAEVITIEVEAGDTDRSSAGGSSDPQRLLKAARERVSDGDHVAALAMLRSVVDRSRSYLHWSVAARFAEEIFASAPEKLDGLPSITLWLCHSYTVDQWVPMLRLAAWRFGLDLRIHKGGYDQYLQEILDPASPLYAAEPDIVLLAVHAGDVRIVAGDDPSASVRAEIDRWTGLLATLRQRSTARLIMHNFAVPNDDPFGNLARSVEVSRTAMMQQLNDALAQAARSDVTLVDCDRLASTLGKRHWFNAKYWHLSKQAVSLEALPDLARHTASVIAATLGRSKKCVVVDLDNTLWGGVVGEEGVDGIRVDPTDYAGEAFRAFQTYLKQLQQRGVLLAVCSKNNPDDAREPFRKRSDMILRLDDFAAFEANWDTKPDNIRRIAEQLSIGLDSIVFVDDNPAEREIVRQSLPEVEVVELSDDPSSYPSVVQDSLLFEIAAFTSEDARRADAYRARREAASLATETGSLEEFLSSLDMTAEIFDVGENALPRVVQLLGKTNQFNLTTRRLTEAELRRRLYDPRSVVWAVRLTDRFAAHGLISVLCADVRDATLHIDVWAMSCRVIGRTLEAAMLASLVECARARGCTGIAGEYIRTAKNDLVAGLYERLGFRRVEENRSGSEVFRLAIEDYVMADSFMTVDRTSTKM